MLETNAATHPPSTFRSVILRMRPDRILRHCVDSRLSSGRTEKPRLAVRSSGRRSSTVLRILEVFRFRSSEMVSYTSDYTDSAGVDFLWYLTRPHQWYVQSYAIRDGVSS